MLSNVSIQKFLDSKDIIISPWENEMMDAARITLHLGEKILVPEKDAVIDIKTKQLPYYEEHMISEENPFRLKPDMFVLGETYEEIGLSEKVGMLLEGRSTIARLGITVVQTAMIIDTGQKPKRMTLEIKNNSQNTILLYPLMKFCRACFFLLNPAATVRHDASGKYKINDSNKPIFENEFKKNL